MSIALLLTRSATIIRRTKTSDSGGDYNEPTFTETSEDVNCYVEQSVQTESGVVSLTMLRAVFEAGTVLHAHDIVEIDSIRYEVVGEPADAWDATRGEVHHREATLERAD